MIFAAKASFLANLQAPILLMIFYFSEHLSYIFVIFIPLFEYFANSLPYPSQEENLYAGN